MNALQVFLIVAAALFLVLLAISHRAAWSYGRFVTLSLAAIVILMPFFWLICSAFKDKAVLNEYTFLPPIDKIDSSTINLDNFRELFAEQQTVQGPVRFWRYMGNSLFLASTGTALSLLFSSMGGYALAKYRFRGRSAIVLFMLACLTIPPVALLSPNYAVIWQLG